MNDHACKEYMMINKNIPRVTRPINIQQKSEFRKKVNSEEKSEFRMYAWRKKKKILMSLVSTSLDKLENSECRNSYWVIINVYVINR